MTDILYIEDELEIGEWVKDELQERGFHVRWFQNGEQALDHLRDIDLVILDVMLPGLDGFSIGTRLKKEAPDIPIIMLSARTAVDDKLQGLSFADDYLTKPFHPEELVARIEVLLRRFQRQTPDIIRLRHLEIFPTENRIIDKRTGNEILLTGKQYQIFQYFLKHPYQILTKEQLFEGVWGEAFFEGDKSLMVHIRHLREKIEEDPANPMIIETIRGIGYRVKL